MFRNGNFDGAIGMYEICANQYNISKYQKKCKDNIAKEVSIIKPTLVEQGGIISGSGETNYYNDADLK